MDIICYACGKGEYPQNSMAAIDNCQHVDENWYVEMDLQLTKDGEVILFHDQDLFIQTNNKKQVSELDLDTLKRILGKESNSEVDKKFNQYPIVTLQEVFIKYPKIRAVLDVKSNNQEIVNKILEVIDSYTNKADIVIVSIHKKIIKEFIKQRPRMFYGAPKYKVQQILYSNCLGLLDAVTFKYDILMMPYTYHNIRVLNKKILKYINKKNRTIWCWMNEGKQVVTVNNKEDLDKMKRLKVDGIFTEYPSEMKQMLSRTDSNNRTL